VEGAELLLSMMFIGLCLISNKQHGSAYVLVVILFVFAVVTGNMCYIVGIRT